MKDVDGIPLNLELMFESFISMIQLIFTY